MLTTALSRSIAVEDYELASKISERLKGLQGSAGLGFAAEILDWRAMGRVVLGPLHWQNLTKRVKHDLLDEDATEIWRI